MDLVIRGGTLVTSSEEIKADIGIRGEKIVSIGRNLPRLGAKVIDARNRYVLPGGIDVHVHFLLPFCGTVSSDDFETGTRAAARGGVTTIIDFAMQDPKFGLLYGIEKRKKQAEGKVCIDYSLHGIITDYNLEIEKELPLVLKAGVSSFKMFMVYESEGWSSDDKALYRALEVSRELSFRLMVHAENEKIIKLLEARVEKARGAFGLALTRPWFVEEEAILRAIKWAEVTQGRLYIVHVSTYRGAAAIMEAQKRGIDVYGETCPHYLVFDESIYKTKEGYLFACCPQVKTKRDRQGLWQAIKDGGISVISTDTCTFTRAQKGMWQGDFKRIPFGLPGVETMIPLLWTQGKRKGRLNLKDIVRLTSTNPAKLFGLYPKKGGILVGADADLIIIDPKKKEKIDSSKMETRCDWSPYEGFELYGFPEITLCRGKIIVDKGKFVGLPGFGKFLKRNKSKLS
jgi:dihydropyrimidinase